VQSLNLGPIWQASDSLFPRAPRFARRPFLKFAPEPSLSPSCIGGMHLRYVFLWRLIIPTAIPTFLLLKRLVCLLISLSRTFPIPWRRLIKDLRKRARWLFQDTAKTLVPLTRISSKSSRSSYDCRRFSIALGSWRRSSTATMIIREGFTV
jgi:hypothetical protein